MSRLGHISCAFLLFVLLAFPLAAGGQREEKAAAPATKTVVLVGTIEVIGSEPHTQGLIRLDDGRLCLVEPDQWAERPLDTGRYTFRLDFQPARKALPGLFPRHDAVVRVLEALAVVD